LRLAEFRGETTLGKIDLKEFGFKKAISCDGLERDTETPMLNFSDGILEIELSAFKIQAVKLIF
jgi:hypothetical protein